MPKRKSPTTDGDDGSKTNTIRKKAKGHWSMGLMSTMEDPEYLIKSDDLVTVIRDKYPKAKYHYLVVSKENISNLRACTGKQHYDLLKHMHKVGTEMATNNKPKDGTLFKLGYHAEPSMDRLHLHVISDDMNSDCLKNKKHWNSYTTKFFLQSEDVLKELKENGKITFPTKDECKNYINSALKCHKCNVIPKNMPELKKHILTHLK